MAAPESVPPWWRVWPHDAATVVVADVADEAGAAVVAEVRRRGGSAGYVRADVADEASVEHLLDRVLADFGHLDGAVNNAGAWQPDVPLHEIGVEVWDRLHDVDLRGVFLCMRAELGLFLRQSEGGAIVNTAGIAGFKAMPGLGAYVAAKHGVIGLTRQAAAEYAEYGIRVNAVAPGMVATPAWSARPVPMRQLYADGQAAGRAAAAEEIASAIVFLLSDDASFVSGDVLVVDSGTLQQ
ncbi:SDR family NAD(P)-dependent oxidoreductase [Rhodococcus aetherivorans]|uniref:SDR family NAD(P)-dependent oxidoreductase n=1 Tax=Rhodococcus aetherivorans TaxID=191292 RepID=UPI00388D3A1A